MFSLPSKLRSNTERSCDDGFTLVEILVVIIIIGILAAVAIPIFLNQQRTARDSATMADVRNLAANVETALVSHPDATEFLIVGGNDRKATTATISVGKPGTCLTRLLSQRQKGLSWSSHTTFPLSQTLDQVSTSFVASIATDESTPAGMEVSTLHTTLRMVALAYDRAPLRLAPHDNPLTQAEQDGRKQYLERRAYSTPQ